MQGPNVNHIEETIEIFPEEWHVIQFVVNHNHPLLAPHQVRLLPSYRYTAEEDKKKKFVTQKKLVFLLDKQYVFWSLRSN